MAAWIKMPLGREVGLDQSNILLDGDLAPPSPKKAELQFSAHVYCGQTAVWMKMSLRTEVDLSPGHIVLDGDPAPLPPRKVHSSPLFSARIYCGHGCPS